MIFKSFSSILNILLLEHYILNLGIILKIFGIIYKYLANTSFRKILNKSKIKKLQNLIICPEFLI